MRLYSPPTRAAMLATVLAPLGASVLHADSEEHAAPLHLTSSSVGAGETSVLRMRSSLPNHPALLIFGETALGTPLGGALPVLRVGPPFVAVESLSTGPNGLVELPFGFPAGTPPGLELFGQAFLVTGGGAVYESNFVPLAPAGSPATWADATGQLPPEVATQLGLDVDFADLDKDGDVDVVTVGPGDDPRPLVMVNDGAGHFTEEGTLRLPAAAWIGASAVEIGDANGDGWKDLFLGGAYDAVAPAPNLLLWNDGTGHFTLDAGFPAGAGRPLDAEWADVDGDGDLDLVTINLEEVDHDESVAAAEVFRNDGGTFTSVFHFSEMPGADSHTSGGGVSLADFDVDGVLDAFIARSDGGSGFQNELWLGNGDGTFTDATATWVPAMEDNSHDVSVLDINGDGLLDLFVYNALGVVPEANHVLVNVGGAFFPANGLLPDELGPFTSIRFSGDAADVDRDGDVDVVIGIHAFPSGPPPLTDGEAVLLLNQGGHQGGVQGHFQVDPGFSFQPAFIDGDPSFEDVDGDGDFDLYLGNGGDILEVLPPQDHLYLNG